MVFENAACSKIRNRVLGPFLDPEFLYPACYFSRIIYFQLKSAAQDDRFIEIGLPLGKP